MGRGVIGETVHSYTWTFAICPNRIEIELSVIAQLQQDVRASALPQQGLLYGTAQPGATEIHNSDPLPVFGYDEFASARANAQRRVVGFYLVRDGSAFLLTPEEISMARDLFREPECVVLLIERRAGAPAEGTFFFWRGDAFVYNLPVPFPIDVMLLAEAGGVRAMVKASAVPALDNYAYPVRRRSGRAGLLAAAAVVMGAILGGWLTYRQPNQAAAIEAPAPEAGASDSAPHKGDLEISWDARAPAILTAISGLLQINDGGTRRQIPLDRTELWFGSVLYAPATTRITVELSVTQVDGSTRALTAATRPAPTYPAAEANRTEPPAVPSEPAARPPETAARTPEAPPPPDERAAGKQALREIPSEPVKPEPVQETRTTPKRFTFETARAPEIKPLTLPDLPHDLPVAVAPPVELTSKLPSTLAAPSLPPPAKAPVRSGRIIWTGTVRRGGVIELDGNSVSVGSINGPLPGAAVSLSVLPAEFSDHGLVVYTRDASKHNRTEQPSAGNGWNLIHYEWDPERVSQVTILESPNPSNHYGRLAVRNDARHCSMMLIDWVTR